MKIFPLVRAVVILFLSVPLLPAAELKRGVVYASREGVDLAMDLSLVGAGGERRPMVICFHGGGWRAGNRADFHQQMGMLAKWGYSSATVTYRFTDVAIWPAQLDDVQAALEWVVAHADEYGIDPERIAVMGASAGGHLALMLGALPSEAEVAESRRVRGVVNFFGPTDLRPENVVEARELVAALAGGPLDEKREVLQALSPITYVGRGDAPVLTFHGTKDTLVPYLAHSVGYHAALGEVQVPNRLVPMEGVGHGFGGDMEANLASLREFLDAYLKGSDLPLVASEDFDGGVERWKVTDGAAWKLEKSGTRSWYALEKKVSDYQPEVRSPFNIALLEGAEVGDFVLDVDVRSTEKPYGHQSLCVFFGQQDASHFYYVHFGRKADEHANSIFLVDGAPRVSIAKLRTDGTDWSAGWHRVRIVRGVESGKIEVFFDDMQKPVMSTVDKTFAGGKVGIGSFDDTGDFDALRLWGKTVE